jgi:hypothetical protein
MNERDFTGHRLFSFSREAGSFSACFVSKSRRRSAGLLALAAFSLMPFATQAAEYTSTGRLSQQLGPFNTTLGEFDTTGANGASDGADYESSMLILTSNATANSSGLHAYAYAEFDKTSPGGSSALYSTSADASAIAKWDDFIVTGPAGAGTVAISVNLFLEGTFALVGDDTPEGVFPPFTASGNTSVSIFASGNNVGSGQFSNTIQNGVTSSATTGILNGFTGSGVISSQTFNVPVNTPFSLQLSLSAGAGAVGKNDQIFYLESTTDFSNTLTFATDRPVFTLPVGYTINSMEAGILNNAVAVPEPSVLLLGLAAIPLLEIVRRKRRSL